MSNGAASLHVDASLMAEPAPAPHPVDSVAATATAAAAALLHAEQHHQQQQHDEEAGEEGEHDETAYEDASFAGVHAHHLQQDEQQTNLAAEALLASSMQHSGQQHHQQQHERNTASGSALTAAGQKPVAFVTKLHDMVSSADPAVHNLIHWCGPEDYIEESEERGGDAFVVIDMGDFSREVLPRYYKHNNWQSFQRQLNLYGFRKLNDAHRSQPNSGPTPWVFRHRYFKRTQPGLLIEIQRKNRDASETAAGTSKRGAKKRKHEAHEAVETGWTDADAQDATQRYIEEKLNTLNARIEAQNEVLRAYSGAMTLVKERSLELASVSIDMLAALSSAVEPQAGTEPRASQESLAYLRSALSALSALVIPSPQGLDLTTEEGGVAVAGPSSASAAGSIQAGPSSRAEKRKQQPEPATLEQLLATFQRNNAAQAAAAEQAATTASAVAAAAASSNAAVGANGHADKANEAHQSNYFAAAASAGSGAAGEAEVDATGAGLEDAEADARGEETFGEPQQQHEQHQQDHEQEELAHTQTEDEQMQDVGEVEAAMGDAEAHAQHLAHHAQA